LSAAAAARVMLQENDSAKYWEFSRLNHELSKGVTLRGMLRFKKAPGGAIPLDEVGTIFDSTIVVCTTSCIYHQYNSRKNFQAAVAAAYLALPTA
jgi:hypothetical protein